MPNHSETQKDSETVKIESFHVIQVDMNEFASSFKEEFVQGVHISVHGIPIPVYPAWNSV